MDRDDFDLTSFDFFLLSDGFKSGEFVCIQVQDKGPGIGIDILDKIFDPFFTTKNGGTGMGLNSVVGIIIRHNGAISVKTSKMSGSEFYAFLSANL